MSLLLMSIMENDITGKSRERDSILAEVAPYSLVGFSGKPEREGKD